MEAVSPGARIRQVQIGVLIAKLQIQITFAFRILQIQSASLPAQLFIDAGVSWSAGTRSERCSHEISWPWGSFLRARCIPPMDICSSRLFRPVFTTNLSRQGTLTICVPHLGIHVLHVLLERRLIVQSTCLVHTDNSRTETRSLLSPRSGRNPFSLATKSATERVPVLTT